MAEGFRGLLDFVGYSVGKQSQPVDGGMRGLLDFVGYSVGNIPEGQPEVPPSVWISWQKHRSRE